MAKALLAMCDITKQFPGVKALAHVTLEVREGEIHALVGENGAGKSTLMNVLSGVHPYGSYEGKIVYDGQDCHFRNIKDSEAKGIVIIHQELALVPYLSIAENMFLGNECARNGVVRWSETYREAQKYLAMVGLQENVHSLIKDIGLGKQQLVEIAKALAKNVRLLILDEPTSSLNDEDAQHLLNLLFSLKEKQGITSIIISHKLNEITYVADRITVIRDGMVVESLDKASDAISEARIIQGMVGREMNRRYPERPECVRPESALEVSHWTVCHPLYTDRKVVDDVSLMVRHGEIVGVYGLIGAGRTELGMSVFGRAYGAKIAGEMKKDGKPITLRSIPEAIREGFAYITEDRKGNGLMLNDSVLHNLTLARMDYVSGHGVIDKGKERHFAGEYRDRIGIKTPTVDQDVGNLSGGNQQKVLLGKWIFAQPDILLLDEPTRGVDVGAKYEIYQIINELAADGKAVVLISSELPEILGMCDRVYVMHEGKLVAELAIGEATQERIMQCIMQASKRSVEEAS